ncbi:proline-rich protein 19 [Carassius auratus]|uniref:Uncharacterized protein LOC113116400 n=1 Tax=Carassius auratus TaxID=7957 RepID=A0A6P6R465_CARAU|nr:uncharacterized protein LOC113116400 [Carassius auratus]XP_026140328.1 uncharacterized protein LOC113116400 [Carassius auratus]
MKMSQQSNKSFVHKHNLLKTSSDRHSSTSKSSCQTANAAHTSKQVCSSSTRTDVHCKSSHKVRRLKTRNERNQIRGLERNRYHTVSQHSRREGGEKAHHPLACSRKERAFAKPFIPQKPSIITEGRLTSNRGIFSHEIRSIDIERLVSEQIKRDELRKEQRNKSVMHITSPLPPSIPDSVTVCCLDEVQEPEKNTPPQVKGKKSSRKEPSEINTSGFQINRGVVVSMGPSREDGKHDRNANCRKEDANSQTRQDSQSSPPRETVVLSFSRNEPIYHLCSTPVETKMNNSYDVSQTGDLKSPNGENHQNGFMNIQRFEKISRTVGFPNMEVTQMLENPQTLTSPSDLDSGARQVGDNVEQGGQMSLSCREAVKRLLTRLCQSSELSVPSLCHPLLAECKETLLQDLQKRHSFQLERNLHRLRSFLNRNQMASQLSSGQRDENCSPSSHTVENEDRCFNRNKEIWTDSAMHQDYLTQDVKQDLDKGAFTKKRRIHEWKTSSNFFSLEEPQQSHIEMFDQWRTARLSQDCMRAQHHRSRQLFNQEQNFTQHAIPKLKSPIWVDHTVDSFSQQQSLSRGEGLKNIDLDLSRISQQWREDKDLDLNLYHIYESRKQKPQASFGGSRFWSHQQQVQDETERCAPFSFSASYLSEGFQYKPFFRCPHPSNTQHRSDCLGMSYCPKTNTPDRVFYPPLYL